MKSKLKQIANKLQENINIALCKREVTMYKKWQIRMYQKQQIRMSIFSI